VTNKGIFYEHGKEPPLDGQPKLHLLIESNDEFRVRSPVIFLLSFITLFFCY
jgi:ATP-dependent RNA helicase DDX46/PRP5